jgi:hypothetical protein
MKFRSQSHNPYSCQISILIFTRSSFIKLFILREFPRFTYIQASGTCIRMHVCMQVPVMKFRSQSHKRKNGPTNRIGSYFPILVRYPYWSLLGHLSSSCSYWESSLGLHTYIKESSLECPDPTLGNRIAKMIKSSTSTSNLCSSHFSYWSLLGHLSSSCSYWESSLGLHTYKLEIVIPSIPIRFFIPIYGQWRS